MKKYATILSRVLPKRKISKCTMSPRDVKNLIPGALASAALLCSFLANIWCETIALPAQDGGRDALYGVFSKKGIVVDEMRDGSYRARETCVDWDDTEVDAKWKTVKSFAIIASILGGILTFWTFLAPCLYFSAESWRLGGSLLFFICICQGLTLMFLDTNACKANEELGDLADLFEDKCERYRGYNANIASVVLWFCAGVSMYAIPAPAQPARGPPETQTVTYTQAEQPDGTTAVTTQVVKGTYTSGEKVKDPEAIEDSDIAK